MAWIHTIDPVDAKGRIGRIYADAVGRSGRIYGIVRLMSLDADVLQASMGLYAATTTSARPPLPRWFRELIAVHVSRINDCLY